MMVSDLISQPIAPSWIRMFAFPADERGSGRAPSEKPRILIVEDDYLAAMELESALQDAGFEVAGTAQSAEQAIRLARSERPVLAIMDIRLQGERDGIDAALQIFKESGIRCIFATAHHTPQARSRAAPASPWGWIAKPYAANSVIDMVKQALAELRK